MCSRYSRAPEYPKDSGVKLALRLADTLRFDPPTMNVDVDDITEEYLVPSYPPAPSYDGDTLVLALAWSVTNFTLFRMATSDAMSDEYADCFSVLPEAPAAPITRPALDDTVDV